MARSEGVSGRKLQTLINLQAIDSRIAAPRGGRRAAPRGDRRHPRRGRGRQEAGRAGQGPARRRPQGPARQGKGPRGRPGQAQQERGPPLRGQDQQGILRRPDRDRGDQAGEGQDGGGGPGPHGGPGAARRRHPRGARRASSSARARAAARKPPLKEQLRGGRGRAGRGAHRAQGAGRPASRPASWPTTTGSCAPAAGWRSSPVTKPNFCGGLPHDDHAPAPPGAPRAGLADPLRVLRPLPLLAVLSSRCPSPAGRASA